MLDSNTMFAYTAHLICMHKGHYAYACIRGILHTCICMHAYSLTAVRHAGFRPPLKACHEPCPHHHHHHQGKGAEQPATAAASPPATAPAAAAAAAPDSKAKEGGKGKADKPAAAPAAKKEDDEVGLHV